MSINLILYIPVIITSIIVIGITHIINYDER